MDTNTAIKPPIKSGWKGNINGFVENTSGTSVGVSEITLRLDRETAHALCNHLTDDSIKRAASCEGPQVDALSTLGAALGRMIDHHAANNGGRAYLK